MLLFGGLHGIGDTYFAVPLEALNLDAENRHFVMDVTKERLENAPGVNKDNWPSRPNPAFINEIYNHYGLENTRRRATKDAVG